MVKIPYIKIPSVRVGSIVPTSNIGTGGATPVPPTPITYLTQWKIVGNSEVHGSEIWSCGEYNPADGKWHILVQPLGGSIADIALTEPLRKVNDVADSIEFPSETEGKALVTRPLKSVDMSSISWSMGSSSKSSSDGFYNIYGVMSDAVKISSGGNSTIQDILSPIYEANSFNNTWAVNENNDKTFGYGLYYGENYRIRVQDSDYSQQDSLNAFIEHVRGAKLIYELETPTTELVDAPQIEEADSYSMVISQGGKAVSWSSFSTDSE